MSAAATIAFAPKKAKTASSFQLGAIIPASFQLARVRNQVSSATKAESFQDKKLQVGNLKQEFFPYKNSAQPI
ncbi:hypothetical protein [Botryobacter ruber]|uniref:hypothetical protein n=1 Tax=Botryobacter ruber TaxID=2171629 RepID=UPI000F64E488|nr:hypothetical protein [Botryobacter ruber]